MNAARIFHVDAPRYLAIAGALIGFLCASARGQPREFLEARLFVTAETPLQLLADDGNVAFADLAQPDEHWATIMIDPSRTFQAIEGFGGAFTDAAADDFAKLPKDSQEEFLKASFDPVKGNGYTLCRTTIHSCDYAAEMYTYDDVAGDTEMQHFTIEHDLRNRLPFIKRARDAARGNLRLYASPWSPPAWMKTNGDMLHGGKLKPEDRQAWANYCVKYIDAYAAVGVPIWGLTVQNEPMASQVWESCIFTAEEEKDFVRDYLGPALQRGGLGDVKVMIWDHNRGIMYQRAEAAYEDPQASKYIWGTAFHWYVGDHFENVRMVHDAFPDKHLVFTEGAVGGDWPAAERLATQMIMDLNNWAEAWTIWNLMLDSEGGPRHAGGLHEGTAVNADLRTGKLTFNPPYFAFGQFTRFIKPGAKRIACTSNNDDFVATAFANPDGRIAVVIANLAAREERFQLWVKGKALQTTSPARGIITMLL